MDFSKQWWIGTFALVAAFYYLIYGAMQYNLAAVASSLNNQPVTVVIDAGHGGEDGGTVSVSGIPESKINLAIALRLEQILALCGVSTSMIRSEDVSVSNGGSTVSERKVSDLKRRVELVNTTPNALLVSIHQNHFSEPKYDGAQVFYSPMSESKSLAQRTQQLLRSGLDPCNRREIKAADSVYLMEQIRCPGILVECGFLSNPEEAALLNTENYQTKLACVLGCALTQYLEEGNNIEV